jgi:LPS O-antigen subunit length determinant protein (WzzB/FepE family)
MYDLAQAQEQTKAETEAWLNGKLKDHFYYRDYPKTNSYETNTYKLRVKNCECEFTDYEEFMSKSKNTKKAKFNFAKMTKAEMREFSDNAGMKASTVTISAFNSEDVIEVETIDHTEEEKTTTDMRSEITIYFGETKLAERAQKALQHYIKLCGGKKEKF